MRKIRRGHFKTFVNNERGSGMLILMVGILIASIFIGFLFFDLSTVFMNKRVTQTGADAAALAVAQVTGEEMRGDLREKVVEELDDLRERWGEFSEPIESVGSGEEEENPEPSPTIEGFIDLFVEEIERENDNRGIPEDIKNWLLDSTVEVDANDALVFLFNGDEVSDMACTFVKGYIGGNNSGLFDRATYFAQENQNDRVKEVLFIPEDFRVYVKTVRNGQYTLVNDDSVPPISSESSARIGSPDGFTINCTQ